MNRPNIKPVSTDIKWKKLKPDADGFYHYAGMRLTKAQLDLFVRPI